MLRAGVFAVLAFAITWTPWLAVLATTGGPTTSGSRTLWGVGGLTGPVAAALIVATATDGRGGPSRLWTCLCRWRVGAWFLLVLSPQYGGTVGHVDAAVNTTATASQGTPMPT